MNLIVIKQEAAENENAGAVHREQHTANSYTSTTFVTFASSAVKAVWLWLATLRRNETAYSIPAHSIALKSIGKVPSVCARCCTRKPNITTLPLPRVKPTTAALRSSRSAP